VIAVEVLRYEVAALKALGEAMDESLQQDGVLGRRGEPRTLVNHRLRLNERLRKATETLLQIEHLVTGRVPSEALEQAAPVLPLAAQIADAHNEESIEHLKPSLVNPQIYLQVFVESGDVQHSDRVRARKLLSRREGKIPERCLCFPGPPARDPAQFREWMEAWRSKQVVPQDGDRKLATLLRTFAKGGAAPQPWQNYERTRKAVERVLDEAVDGGEAVETRERDPAIEPFWRLLLSPDEGTTPKQRLEALLALEDAGVLRRCTCVTPKGPRLWEEDLDESRAFVIRALPRRDELAAQACVAFPETHWALREALDERLLRVPDVPPEDENAEAA
jgi:hypothetical protein